MTASGHPLHLLRERVLPIAILRGPACVCRLRETVTGQERTIDPKARIVDVSPWTNRSARLRQLWAAIFGWEYSYESWHI